MTSLITPPATLIMHAKRYLTSTSKILDLACGNGRNGCYLANLGHLITYLDKNELALNDIKRKVGHGDYIQTDLETTPPYRLKQSEYDAVIVIRYLHRELMPTIIEAIKPGGLIIYETFTHRQAAIGRPKNPNFLLNDGELTTTFKKFEPLYYFEGFDEQQQAFISQFIGRKP